MFIDFGSNERCQFVMMSYAVMTVTRKVLPRVICENSDTWKPFKRTIVHASPWN